MNRNILISVVFLMLLLPLFLLAQADADPEKSRHDSNRVYLLKKQVPEELKMLFYGSIRVRFGAIFQEPPKAEVANHLSRIGIKGQYEFLPGISALGRFELGVNMVGENPQFMDKGDPGYAYGQGDQAVSTRVGIVGISSPYGTLTIGKQWSTYYDVGEFTDRFFQFGSKAAGVYNVGDGGISGTGRAEKAMQYRHKIWNFSLGLQTQSRSRNPENKTFFATYGGSLVYEFIPGISVGGAFNQVLDGMDDPGPNDPVKGDIARILGATFKMDRISFSGIFTSSNQHDVDNMGAFFDSEGYEFWAQYQLTSRLFIMAGMNYLAPRNMPEDYQFRLIQYPVDLVYNIGSDPEKSSNVQLTMGLRFNDSRNADGTPVNDPIVYVGADFGW